MTLTGLVVLLAALFGMAIGSFTNVVVWRVPQHASVVSPPSACPRCEHPIRPYDNVPVVSWLVLRARCRDCGEPISARYPLVEAGVGAGFALVAWWAMAQGHAWALPAMAYLVAITVALALIDIDVRRLPDLIVLPSYLVALGLLALAAWNPGGAADWPALGRAAIGAVAMFAVYLLMVVVYPKGMGLGDVKLAGVLGLYLGWVGWGALVVGWFAAFLLGGLYSAALLVARRASGKSAIPFGPWMLAGAWLGIVAGQAVWQAYLGVLR